MEKRVSFEVSCFDGNVKKNGGFWRREGINPVKGCN